ncbi:hypothetical protein AD951_06900 [Acetobacter malorum]|uniref:Yop protein translocation protein D periplasmic domain-containing protein n=1 Tax=Acetobacter malorum TaxID=178901 RepID=A0A149UN15_9PROT|nr:hypothetical protein [Acetobacter malorum]KXV69390.1 hypothetical protein AD951_06900 [Acetobacter malorum]
MQTGDFFVGKSLNNDAVIADQNLSDTHFLIRAKAFGVELTAQEGNLHLASGHILQKSTSKTFYKTIQFSGGSTRFKLVVPSKTRLHAARYGASILIFLMLASLLSVYVRHMHHSTIPNTPHLAAAPPIPTRSTMLAALKDKLLTEHLDKIIISTGADGALIATGAEQPEEKDIWEAVKLWFDTTYGTETVLLDRVSFLHATTHSPLQIAGVALGDTPYVLDTAGRRLPCGSTVEDGWVIDQILTDKILLHRGAEHLTVRF